VRQAVDAWAKASAGHAAEEPVQVSTLAPGDHIVVRDQEIVPVDAVLLSGTAHIDNSFITGEPLPVRKVQGETVRAGGRQRGAAIELEVLRTFADSRLKRLWAEQDGGHERPVMPRMIDGVARRFTIAVLLISLGAALYWWGKDAAQVWPVVTAVLIVACPCALALSMPFAYGHTIRLLGKQGLFLRDAEVVERMAHVDTVIFDKTGTLTAREAHDVEWTGARLSEEDLADVRSLARNSTHPLSAVLAEHIKQPFSEATDVQETAGQGIRGVVHARSVRIGSAAFCGADEAPRTEGEAHVYVTISGVARGHFRIRKHARTGIGGAVQELRRKLRVGLLTGDARLDHALEAVFVGTDVRTRCSPLDKSNAIKSEQAAGHRVMMVGDGLNDAAALGQSDVGITVTETSAALTPASDAIMDAAAVARLPHFLRMARRARRIVIGSLCISLCYNITGVSFAVSGQLTPLIAAVLMPLSSVSVVGFVTAAVTIASRKRR
jgi:Cu+-exporting ATPase